jgi:protein SCO1/2
MDHSASLYLMGPDGRFITKFAHGITPKDLVKELALILP